MKNTIILGAGSYGEVFLTYLIEQGFNVIGFYDDDLKNKDRTIQGIKVLGRYQDLFNSKSKENIHQVICPIGDNFIRTKYLTELNKFGYKTPNFIHHSVLINKDVILGKGIYLLPGVIIMPHTIIQDFVIVSLGSKIAHHTEIKKGAFISTGVNIGANIIIEELAFLGISSTIMTGVKKIGRNALVGCGAVVIRNVKDGHIVAGVPAKTIRVKEIN